MVSFTEQVTPGFSPVQVTPPLQGLSTTLYMNAQRVGCPGCWLYWIPRQLGSRVQPFRHLDADSENEDFDLSLGIVESIPPEQQLPAYSVYVVEEGDGAGSVPAGEGDAAGFAGFAGMPVPVPIAAFCHPSRGQLPFPPSTFPHVVPVLMVLQGKHPPGRAPSAEPPATTSSLLSHAHRRSGSAEHVAVVMTEAERKQNGSRRE